MYFASYTVDAKTNDPPSEAFHAVVPPAAAPSSIIPLPDKLSSSAACANLLLLSRFLPSSSTSALNSSAPSWFLRSHPEVSAEGHRQ